MAYRVVGPGGEPGTDETVAGIGTGVVEAELPAVGVVVVAGAGDTEVTEFCVGALGTGFGGWSCFASPLQIATTINRSPASARGP
jgi:hypothetical protein